MKRALVIAAAAAATLLTATAANASRVNWSIGINVPPVATYVSGPGYYAPSYYGTPYYAPAPTYYPPRAIFAPRARFWGPPAAPVRPWFGGHDRWHHGDGRDGHVGWRR